MVMLIWLQLVSCQLIRWFCTMALRVCDWDVLAKDSSV